MFSSCFLEKSQKAGGDKRGTRLCGETYCLTNGLVSARTGPLPDLHVRSSLLPFHNSQLAKELLRIRGLPYEYLSHELWPQCTTADQDTHLFKN